MIQRQQLPFLIKLLDDDSSDVQQKVIHELIVYGPSLKKDLKNLAVTINPTQHDRLRIVLERQKEISFHKAWSTWLEETTEMAKLERALSILSEYLQDPFEEETLTELLDKLADEYRSKFRSVSERILAQFLFKEKGLHGNENDYYNLQNSNLSYVLTRKKGVPLSLASVYMLVANRLGLYVEGCHFPGHFLARFYSKNKPFYVDCFNAGQVIEEKEILRLREDVLEGIDNILHENANAESIIRRYLANLIRAYEIQEDEKRMNVIIELFKDLEIRMANKHMKDITPEDIIRTIRANFESGQVIKHKRYGYRGIIVDVDEECFAEDAWYYGNQTQPDRYQPWYHVLVSGSDQVTYVAQSNLIEDPTDEKVSHPLLTYFFSESNDGSYVRNENPWPDNEL